MRKRAEELGAEPGDGDLPVGPAQDELAQLARTLNSLLKRVRRSNAREKQMVSDAAHELRTPLAALKTQLELAHDDFADADALAARVVLAEQSVNRLASLANNLLELSRVEAAKNRSVTATTSQLVTELMGSIDRARMLALAKSVDVGFDLVGVDNDLTFALDAQSFGRLTDNLLSNAVAAVDHDGTVALTMTQDEEGIAVEVSDDGPGVPESFIPRAFERFTRPDSARTEGVGGSGLGLALVRAIATSAGGEAALHNTYPGLTVVVVIPKM
jgi:signal transduction histidine kinase